MTIESHIAWAAATSKIKQEGERFIDMMNQLGQSRELSLAKTKIEEAVMWATKHTVQKFTDEYAKAAEREADAREG